MHEVCVHKKKEQNKGGQGKGKMTRYEYTFNTIIYSRRDRIKEEEQNKHVSAQAAEAESRESKGPDCTAVVQNSAPYMRTRVRWNTVDFNNNS